VNKQLPNREQALKLLKDNQCSDRVINHCQAVAQLALDIAEELKAKGFAVDLDLVLAGALLHDLGRSKSHGVDHGLVGAKLAELAGLPSPVVNIIKRHIGAGITPQEAQHFGWPADVYTPQTIEEKIVSYADKLIDYTTKVPVEMEIKHLQMAQKNDAALRVQKLHEEITGLLGHKA
jgi:uncharacterized protein